MDGENFRFVHLLNLPKYGLVSLWNWMCVKDPFFTNPVTNFGINLPFSAGPCRALIMIIKITAMSWLPLLRFHNFFTLAFWIDLSVQH